MAACAWVFFAAHARAADSPPLVLVVRSDTAELSEDRVRQAVASELGIEVIGASEVTGRTVRGTLTITYRPSRDELAVTYDDARRGTLSRILPAPKNIDDATIMGALLAGNLVRSEAEELLPADAMPAKTTAGGPAPQEALLADKTTDNPYSPPPSARKINVAFLYPFATNAGDPDTRVLFADIGIIHSRIGALEGTQVGLVNVVGTYMFGVQLGGATNVVQGRAAGVELAGLANLNAGGVEGVQLAPALNRAKAVDGVQVSAVNVATRVEGAQVGLFNVASDVRGAQVGIVNVADDVEGIPIGLVSVTKTGGVHPSSWFSGSNSELSGHFGIKFATKYTYTMPTFSMLGFAQDEPQRFGAGLTVGARIPIERAFIDIDVGATIRFDGNQVLGRLRALGGYNLFDHLSVFVGGGAVVDAEREPSRELVAMRPELVAGVAF